MRSGDILKPSWIFRKDRRFHRAHSWAMKMDALRVRVGLDAFAADLLGSSMSVVLPTVGSLLRENEPGCWLVDESGTTPLKMPASGRVVAVNRNLQEQPALIHDDPYEGGWILEIALENPDQALEGLLDAGTMEKRAETHWEALQKKVETHLRKESNRVGPTMADGGTRVTNIRDLLGLPAYRRLIMEFL